MVTLEGLYSMRGMEAWSYNQQGTRGMSSPGVSARWSGAPQLQFTPFCSWARCLWERERPCSGSCSRRSIYLWMSNLDRLGGRFSGAPTIRTEVGGLNPLQISSKAAPSKKPKIDRSYPQHMLLNRWSGTLLAEEVQE